MPPWILIRRHQPPGPEAGADALVEVRDQGGLGRRRRRRRFLVDGALHAVAVLPDPDQARAAGHVALQVAVDQHQVGDPARLDAPAVLEPEDSGRRRGGGGQRLGAGQSGAHEKLQLAVLGDAGPGARIRGVGPREQAHAGRVQAAHVRDCRLAPRGGPGLVGQVGEPVGQRLALHGGHGGPGRPLRQLDVDSVAAHRGHDRQRRDDEDAGGGDPRRLRLVGHRVAPDVHEAVGAEVDRLQRVLELGHVDDGEQALGVRSRDEGANRLRIERRDVHVGTAVLVHDLDPVRPLGLARRDPGRGAGGAAHGLYRDPELRAVPAVGGRQHAGGEEIGFVSALQRRAGGALRGGEGRVRELIEHGRHAEADGVVQRGAERVHVRVYQPGGQGPPAAVDPGHVVRDVQRGPDRADATVLHPHVVVRQETLAVEDCGADDGEAPLRQRIVSALRRRPPARRRLRQRHQRAHEHDDDRRPVGHRPPHDLLRSAHPPPPGSVAPPNPVAGSVFGPSPTAPRACAAALTPCVLRRELLVSCH